MKKGIDISYFQGNIDFKKVKTDGIDFIIPRCGYGKSNKDSKFSEYVAGALAAGIEVPGIYHFSYALNEENAREEARQAVKFAQEAGLPKETIIFFDLEYDSVDYAKRYAVNLDKARCIAHTNAFCQEVQNHGYRTGIYANQDYLNRMYDDATIKKYIFWYANWNGGKTPSVKCAFHQWTEKGRVNGINGNVDMDYYYGGAEAPAKKPMTPEEIEKVAKEVLDGKYGNGNERRSKLSLAGYDYSAVQNRVNELVAELEKAKAETSEPVNEEPKPTPKFTTEEMVQKVINGEYGNGDERKQKLEAEGYDYRKIQNAVNQALYKPKQVSPAKSFDRKIAGTYEVTATALNCRYIPAVYQPENVVKIFKKGEKVQCYGYFTNANGPWYLVKQGNDVGYVASNYLKKV
jgi:GH25 family lysozyme M1 (1,4-beta-N-acetylmuramidase)